MIKLNDILKLEDLSNVKVRFNLMFRHNWNPIEIFEDGDMTALLEGQYWNYKKQKSYKNGQVTIGFLKISPEDDLWLLFHVGRVTKDLNKLNAIGYEHETIEEYEKYFGRLIIRYKNSAQMMVRKAESVFDGCEVAQILPARYDNDVFPGYENINLSWMDLSRVLVKDNWKTALQNQKGVYLIIDTSNGKKYVGSAYGQNMILGRWQNYVKTGHGGNSELRKLSIDHIRNNFRFSILDIYKSTIDDQFIIQRENWWKEVLQTRDFGYNEN